VSPRPAQATVAPKPIDLELATALLEQPPGGYTAASPDAYNNGPLDIRAAAALEDDVLAEWSELKTRGFTRGFIRTWLGPRQIVAVASVYEFNDEAGAAGYLADAAVTLTGRGATPFDVPDVTGAHATTQIETGQQTHAVAFVRGKRFFLLIAAGANATPDDAAQLALAQSSKTPVP
jgi:hypothetical protein